MKNQETAVNRLAVFPGSRGSLVTTERGTWAIGGSIDHALANRLHDDPELFVWSWQVKDSAPVCIRARVLSRRTEPVSRLLHAKVEKDTVAVWRLDLTRILHVFDAHSINASPRNCWPSVSGLNLPLMLMQPFSTPATTCEHSRHFSDIHCTTMKRQEETGSQVGVGR